MVEKGRSMIKCGAAVEDIGVTWLNTYVVSCPRGQIMKTHALWHGKSEGHFVDVRVFLSRYHHMSNDVIQMMTEFPCDKVLSSYVFG